MCCCGAVCREFDNSSLMLSLFGVLVVTVFLRLVESDLSHLRYCCICWWLFCFGEGEITLLILGITGLTVEKVHVLLGVGRH